MITHQATSRSRGVAIFRKDIIGNPGLSLPLGLAALGWLFLAFAHQAHGGLPLCIGGSGGFGQQFQSALAAQWTVTDPKVSLTWAMMVLAMMLPITATHLSVATAKSLPRLRWHVLCGAMMGYLGVWMALGLPYFALYLLASTVASLTTWPIVPVVLYGSAVLWCFSPLRQTALRRCHPVPAFFGDGQTHVISAARWGARLAVYCAAVCFLAMAAPMLSGQGILGMLLATHILLAERRAQSPKPRDMALPLSLLAAAALAQSALA